MQENMLNNTPHTVNGKNNDSHNVLALAGKGGVGKSTIALNLALAMTHAGASTILLDTNITSPSMSQLLGSTHLPHTIQEVLANKCTPQQALYQHPTGLRFVPASIAAEHAHTQLTRLPALLRHYQTQAQTLILDGPAGFGTDAQTVLGNATNNLIVVTPDRLSITEGLRLRHACPNVRGMIVNKTTTETLSEKFLLAPILATLPEEHMLQHAARLGQPFNHISPATLFATQIAALAQQCLRL